MRSSRRQFIKTSLWASASVAAMPVWSRAQGANEDIRLAVVGFNGQGKGHIQTFQKIKGVRVVALCDVDKNVLEREAKKFREDNKKIETYTDVRKLLENKDIDAISTATPNHWHSLVSIWACQAGKDVYVEKPVSHNVWEGRKLVEAARKYNRIVQTGTQNRSRHDLKEAFAWVHEGHLGKIKVVRGLCYKRRPSIGRISGTQPIPEGIDYDLWCGPAPKEPLKRKNLHYDWHWVWATGNGDLGNQGIHQMDVARWALGKNELSPRVFSVGGRVGYEDDGQTPNTQFVVHDYGEALLIFEVRGLPKTAVAPGEEDEKKGAMDKYKGESISVIVECEGGYLSDNVAFDKEGKQIKTFKGGESHHANFIKAVRSRKQSDLNAEILEGHLSSALCHTGNISYRLGKQASPDEIREKLKADPAALETLGRMEEHLAANKVDLNSNRLVLGEFLKMDPKTERFIGNNKANELLTREYREPFVVPEKV